MRRLILLVLLSAGICAAQSDGPATLPTLMNTTFPGTTGYTVKTVCASGCDYSDPATAYAAVSCKTVLRIRAGQSFTDSFTAGKACTAGNWIILMSDNCTSAGSCTNLPTQGNRVTAAMASYMATIADTNTTNAVTITVGSGAAYNWFGPGLEITGPANGTTGTNDVTVDADTTVNNIIYDRDYITCAAGQDCQRGAGFEGAYEAVVDSSITQMHSVTAEQAQAIAEFGGLGPYKIVNNLLGGAGEPILFGGSDCPTVANSPHDIEIAGNDLYYDFGSRSSTFLTTLAGNVRSVIELKEGVRVLIQANVLDESAVAGQSADTYTNGFLTWAVAQCSNSLSANTDVVYRFNKNLHPDNDVELAGGYTADYGYTAASAKNYSVHDNLIDDQNATNGEGLNSIGFTAESYSSLITYNISFNHNTLVASDAGGVAAMEFFAQTGGLLSGTQVITNNIVFNGGYGVEGTLDGTTTFGLTGINSTIQSGYTITKNAIIGGTGTQWPTGNIVPATATAMDFTNFNSGNGGNYALTSSSPGYHAGTDGKDIGVSDFSCLNTITALATAGTYAESAATCADEYDSSGSSNSSCGPGCTLGAGAAIQ